MLVWPRSKIKATPLTDYHQIYLLEAMSEECRQVVVELTVYYFQVVLKVSREALHVKKDLLKVLFDYRKDPCQLDVPQPRHDVIGDCVILITDQNREFYVEAFHELFAFGVLGLAQADLPVTQ